MKDLKPVDLNGNYMKRISFLFFLLLFYSCSTERKINKAINILQKNPIALSNLCVNTFPNKDTVIYKQDYVFDTIWQINPTEIDTVFKNDTIFITKTSPTKILLKTIVKTKEIIKEPMAKIEQQRNLYIECQGRYAEANQKLEVANAERKYWKERFWWLLLFACALAGYIVRKPVARIISKFPI